MSTSFHITENDLAPPISAVLKAGSPLAEVDLTGATIRFHMRDSSGTVVLNAAASNDQVGDGSDGSKGKVHYDWQAGDTDQAGDFQGEWEVTDAAGKPRTFPTGGAKTTIVIHGEIA